MKAHTYSPPGFPACLLFLLMFLSPGTVLAAPPVNDNFANATVLTGLPASAGGTNREATVQTGEPDETEGAGGTSVWWRWTAPVAGWVEINTAGSDFDTILAVYTGNSLTSMDLVGWNDESGLTSQSRVRFQAISGTVYLFQIQGYLEDTGDISLGIKTTPAPQPPVLERLTISPAVADVTAGFVALDAEIQFTAPDQLQYVDLRFTGPAGDEFDVYLELGWDLTLVSGSPAGGVCRGQFYVPAHRAAGTWLVSEVKLYDVADGETVYAGAGNPALPAGSSPSITLVNQGPADLLPPEVISGTITPDPVNVTPGAQTVTVTVAATDDRMVDAIYMNIASAGGNFNSGLYLSSPDLISGTTQSGIWRQTFTIPAYSSPGTWTVTYEIGDKSGRYRYYGEDDPLPVAAQATLAVQNSGLVDTANPLLLSLITSMASVTAASLPAEVAVTLQASDDIGVTAAAALLESPGGNSYLNFPLTRTAGTAASGTWTGTLTVNGTYPAGTYLIGIELTDVVGNQVSLGAIFPYWESLPAGFPQSISVIGGPPDAYTAWRAAHPALAGPSGLPGADHDGDVLPNAVEFLCGTDPLLNSQPGGPDPDASRAPAYSLTATHLRVDYRLSSANAALGSGNPLALQPQSTSSLLVLWTNVTPAPVSGDLWRAEIPLGAGPRQFLRFVVLP